MSCGERLAPFDIVELREITSYDELELDTLGTAYAMWTGMGILGTTLLGVFLFHEKLSVPQVICVILIVVGIAGLKILAKE